MEIYQIVLIVIGSILLLFLVYCFIIGRIFYKVSFSRRKNDKDFAKLENPEDKKKPNRVWFFSNELEELKITSFDKLKLKGYLLNNNSSKLAIVIHGYRGRYYSCVGQARIFYEAGYDVLCINNRAHDTSEGKYFSMGPKERKDTLKWIDFMIKRNPNYQIVLFGASMGAHIAMVTGASKDIQPNVKCIIEDCGYASLKEILLKSATANNVKAPRFAISLGNLYAKIFHHVSFNDSTEDAFKNLKLPILFIHGEEDTYVPFENMAKNASYVPEGIYKEIVSFPGIAHNNCVSEYDKYKEVSINFVNKFIK